MEYLSSEKLEKLFTQKNVLRKRMSNREKMSQSNCTIVMAYISGQMIVISHLFILCNYYIVKPCSLKKKKPDIADI
jgi:hypothetical protein